MTNEASARTTVTAIKEWEVNVAAFFVCVFWCYWRRRLKTVEYLLPFLFEYKLYNTLTNREIQQRNFSEKFRPIKSIRGDHYLLSERNPNREQDESAQSNSKLWPDFVLHSKHQRHQASGTREENEMAFVQRKHQVSTREEPNWRRNEQRLQLVLKQIRINALVAYHGWRFLLLLLVRVHFKAR